MRSIKQLIKNNLDNQFYYTSSPEQLNVFVNRLEEIYRTISSDAVNREVKAIETYYKQWLSDYANQATYQLELQSYNMLCSYNRMRNIDPSLVGQVSLYKALVKLIDSTRQVSSELINKLRGLQLTEGSFFDLQAFLWAAAELQLQHIKQQQPINKYTFANFEDRGLEPIAEMRIKGIAYVNRVLDAYLDKQTLPNLVLVGTIGCGKTHVSNAIINMITAINNSITTGIITGAKLVKLYTSSDFKNEEERRKEINRLINTDVLVVDDIAKVNTKNPDVVESMRDFINGRYEAGRGTIISFNDFDKLPLDNSMIDRIKETCMFSIDINPQLNIPSYRQEKLALANNCWNQQYLVSVKQEVC